MPLTHYLKTYFSENKKHGSKDRKWISHFCFSYYRLGKALANIEIEKRLPIAVYLCTEDLSDLQGYLPNDWVVTDLLDDKIQCMHLLYGFQLEDIFPFPELLMPSIDHISFCKSILVQPDVFLRVRPRKTDKVNRAFEQANIPIEMKENVVRLKGRIAVEQILEINKDVVIQDLNSQRIAALFPDEKISSIWDCCAASGGKTLLLRDAYPKARITVSDIRATILQNHKKRMQEAGVNVQKYMVADLTQSVDLSEQYDLVVCDAPCTGSGTWARTPEELYFFEKNILKSISDLQLKIVQRIFENIKNGGYLVYITCSVLSNEDEKLLHQACEKLNLSIIKQRMLVGADERADSMYGCLLKKLG